MFDSDVSVARTSRRAVVAGGWPLTSTLDCQVLPVSPFASFSLPSSASPPPPAHHTSQLSGPGHDRRGTPLLCSDVPTFRRCLDPWANPWQVLWTVNGTLNVVALMSGILPTHYLGLSFWEGGSFTRVLGKVEEQDALPMQPACSPFYSEELTVTSGLAPA